MNVSEQVRFFMEPKSIALIGVPRRTGKASLNILENLLNYGFNGEIYPVNPSADEIMGIKSYPSLRDIPGNVDLVLIATPRPAVLGAVRECAGKRPKAVIILTQGFADFDKEGFALEAEITRLIKETGGRVLGPNSIGVANAYSNLTTSFARPEKTRLPVAVISQSGSFFTGTQRFIQSGKTIDLGNTCDIDFSDCLEYFEDDPEIKVIALYIEGIRNGERFIRVSKRVTKKKPIIALKSGRTEFGRKAAQSHTAQLTGNDEIYDAAFKQAGVIRVADIEEMSDLVKAFSCLPLMKGRGLGIVTMSGSGGVLATDACYDYGLRMAELSPDTKSKIRELSLPWSNIGNPIDIWPIIFRDTKKKLSQRYMEMSEMVLDIVAADNTVDGIIFFAGIFSKQDEVDPTETVLHITKRWKEKPVVCLLHGLYSEVTTRLEETKHTVVFPSIERAVRALSRLYQYARFSDKSS